MEELIIAGVSQCFPYNLQRFPIVNAKVFPESKIVNAPIFFVVQGLNGFVSTGANAKKLYCRRMGLGKGMEIFHWKSLF